MRKKNGSTTLPEATVSRQRSVHSKLQSFKNKSSRIVTCDQSILRFKYKSERFDLKLQTFGIKPNRFSVRLSSCIDVINEWMIQNTLRLNQDKTEFFLIANRNVSAALSDISLKLGELSIQRSTLIKNLGVTFDDSLTMYCQINTICKSVNFHIRNIWRIRRFITTEACHHIVRGLVLSRLDYANSLLFGAREADLTRLQRLQNKAAVVIP